MAQARSVGLPGALGKLCDILGVPLDKAKDKQGKQLIQLFCKPLPKNRKERRATKLTHPVEWARFVDYAGLDVEAMREVYKRCRRGTTRAPSASCGSSTRRSTTRLRDRPRPRPRRDHRRRAEQKRLGKRTVDLTDGDVESTNQRDALLKHLLEECGVTCPICRRARSSGASTTRTCPTPRAS
jgi:DNA polymerase